MDNGGRSYSIITPTFSKERNNDRSSKYAIHLKQNREDFHFSQEDTLTARLSAFSVNARACPSQRARAHTAI